MIYFIFIARVADGLPLAAVIEENEKFRRDVLQYQNQVKSLVCRLTPTSPSRCTLVTGPYLFHYLLDHGVCYVILTSAQFNRTTAFSFLESLQNEFYSNYSDRIHTVSRPYAFIDFDYEIQKLQKSYTDTRSSNMNQLNVALQDVQRIMVKNIDDVLQRGEALLTLDARASNLSSMSQKYRQDAAALNVQSAYVKYVLCCIFLISVLIFFYIRFF